MGRFVSTLALVLVLAGLAGYIYYLDRQRRPTRRREGEGLRRPSTPTTSRKCGSRSDDGEATRLKKSGGTWTARRAGAGRGGRRRAVDHRQQPGVARDRARRGREAGGPEGLRPRAGAHRRVASRSRASGRAAHPAGRQDADRRRPLRQAARTRRACSWCRRSSSRTFNKNTVRAARQGGAEGRPRRRPTASS